MTTFKIKSTFEESLKKIENNQRIATENLAKRTHNSSVRNRQIPILTGATRSSAIVRPIANDKALLKYSTPYVEIIWKSNKSGVPEWSKRTFQTRKQNLLKQLTKEMFSDSRPKQIQLTTGAKKKNG